MGHEVDFRPQLGKIRIVKMGDGSFEPQVFVVPPNAQKPIWAFLDQRPEEDGNEIGFYFRRDGKKKNTLEDAHALIAYYREFKKRIKAANKVDLVVENMNETLIAEA